MVVALISVRKIGAQEVGLEMLHSSQAEPEVLVGSLDNYTKIAGELRLVPEVLCHSESSQGIV